jgi:starch synthase
VLFVGRITRQKGVTHLVDAIRYLPQDTQIVLCAGAPDTPGIAAELREKVEAARAHHPRIVWIEKMVTKPEAIQLYSNCRVFCCPSVYEPFGIINLEAMACRAPVVASATGGIKEVVVEGKTGCLVPFDEMLEDPERCQQFGDAGRKRVEELFSWTAIAQQTIALYQQLLDARKVPAG